MKKILVAALVFGAVSAAPAQSPVTPGWSAFAGCWTPIPNDDRLVSVRDPRICIVPSGDNGADLVSFVIDSVTDRTRIEADGQRREVARQGCSGWETAQFSADGRRLYMSSEQQCAGGIKRVTSGVFAMTSNGDWVNAVNVAADSVNSVRVSRYMSVALGQSMPDGIHAALASREISDRTSRIVAQGVVGTSAVIEASRFLSAPTTEAWLAELEQDFNLDEKTLVRLAEAGVDPAVIDVMVAVSNPQMFRVQSTGAGITMSESDSVDARRLARQSACMTPAFDPWAYYAYDPCDPYHRYSYYRYRGSYRYGDPYFGYSPYDPYGYGYGYGRYNNYGPVVIVVRGSEGERGHGRMTKDGYSRGTASTSGTAERQQTTRTSSPRSEGSTSTTSSSGQSGETSSSSGSGSTSSGRTATRKPPAN